MLAVQSGHLRIIEIFLTKSINLQAINPRTKTTIAQKLFETLLKGFAEGKIVIGDTDSSAEQAITTPLQQEDITINTPITTNRRTAWGNVHELHINPLCIALEATDDRAAATLTRIFASQGAQLTDSEVDRLSDTALIRLASIAQPALQELTESTLDRNTLSVVQSFTG